MSKLVNAKNLFMDISLDGPSLKSTRAGKQIQALRFNKEQSYVQFLSKLNRLLSKACLEKTECLRVIKRALPPSSPLASVESLQEFGDHVKTFDQSVKATKWAERKQITKEGLLNVKVNSKENQLKLYRGKRGSRPNRKKKNSMDELRIRSPSPIVSSWETLDMPI